MGCPHSRGQVEPDDSLETKKELLADPVSPVSPTIAKLNTPPTVERQRSVTFMAASSSSSDHGKPEEPPAPVPPPPVNRRRRSSVSGESMSSPSVLDGLTRVVIPKSLETRTRLQAAVKNNLLFRTLTEEALAEVLDAMFEEEFDAGHMLIKQGDLDGEYFYVVGEGGVFDIFVNGHKVVTVRAGGSFGELALMYNAPRAATVVAVTHSTVYALDRITFKRTLMNNSNKKRELHVGFLRSIPLLGALEENEMNKVADALVDIKFKDGECIIRQGDPGEVFYILEEGKLSVKQHRPKQDEEVELAVLTTGAYFGEIALLNDAPRVASVLASGDAKCVMLDRAAFTRLLGPCSDLLRRNITQYDTIDVVLEKRRMREAKADGRRYSTHHAPNIRDVTPDRPPSAASMDNAITSLPAL